jgi:RNA polymerase sigma-70 factor (ECF subfamily)
MLRVARRYVASHAIAEKVVQDTWIAVITRILKFEGRSSLRTLAVRGDDQHCQGPLDS